MDRAAATLTGVLLMAASVAPAFGATETMTGQLIDLGNYAAGHTPAEYAGVHARACALEGFEVGLLTADGKVYHIAGDLAANSNAKLLPYMLAKTVTISGEVSNKDDQIFINGTAIK